MVTHRDRLALSGFELIQWLAQQKRGSVLVLKQPDGSPESELTEDLLSILDTFSCRLHDSEGTAQQSRRIRVYPATQQKLMLRTWMDASRWTCNLTVEILKSGTPASWKTVAARVIAELECRHPEWAPVPYQVKGTSVRRACRAMSNLRKANKELAEAKAKGV